MTFTQQEYNRYMEYTNNKLNEINQIISVKKNFEWISKLTFEEWVRWQKNEIKMFTNTKELHDNI